MKSLTYLLAGFLNFAPLAARLLQSGPALSSSPAPFVLKWVSSALALAGTYHAVSAGSAVLASASSISGTVGTRLSYQIKINDGENRSAESWEINGQTYTRTGSASAGFPPGLSLGLSTGIISGIPTQGGEYDIDITAWEHPRLTGASLNFSLHFSIAGGAVIAPTITAPPQGGTIDEGGLFSFSVTATGTQPFHYQWRHNGGAIPDATSPTLLLNPVQLSDAGTYTVLVSNDGGTVVSTEVTLTVTSSATGPTIITPPTSVALHTGEPLHLNVVAGGTEPLTYLWQHDGADIPDPTGSSVTRSAATGSDAGTYFVKVSGPGGTVTSDGITVTVVPMTMQVTRASGAGFEVVLTTIAGREYTLETTTDLASGHWETVQTATATSERTAMKDTHSAESARFWRYSVVQAP